jgi:hypothetical protein
VKSIRRTRNVSFSKLRGISLCPRVFRAMFEAQLKRHDGHFHLESTGQGKPSTRRRGQTSRRSFAWPGSSGMTVDAARDNEGRGGTRRGKRGFCHDIPEPRRRHAKRKWPRKYCTSTPADRHSSQKVFISVISDGR